LSLKEIEETKKEIIDQLSKVYPWKKEKIEAIIKSPKIKEEQIALIYKKIKSKEKISLIDISRVIPELNNVFTKEEKEELIKKAKQKTINSIKKSIENKYPEVDISWDKLKDLEDLAVKYLNLNEDNAIMLNEIVENKSFQLKDFYSLIFEGTAKWTWFTFGLLSKWIVPISAIWLDLNI